MSHRTWISAMSALALAASCTPALDDAPDVDELSTSISAAAPGRVIVKLRSAPSSLAAQSAVARVGGRIAASFPRLGGLAVVALPSGASTAEALAALRKDPAVVYAEPDAVVHLAGDVGATAIPNDPRFGELWALHNTGQSGGTPDADIDAVEAWDISTGSRDVVVGVVDTGIDVTHPDLAANMWVNPREIAGNGIDDDGNGVVDDVHGYNAITGGGDPTDENNHGTHVAGTLAAVGNNGVGVTGVAWRTSIMALKFLDANGSGTLAGAIAVIDYAVGQRTAGVNLRVLSNSWGGGGFNQALFDAISAANAAGILFVAAAGGSGSNNDLTPAFPASYDVPNVVAVAATDRQDRLAGFSNWGPTSVDIAAPGVDILSTVRGGYQVYSGTSMSTPIVAGVAALVLAVDGSLDTAEVKDVVLATGDPLPSLAGLIATGRRVNAASALAAVAPPPDGPLELSIESVSRVRDSFEFRVGLVWRGASGRLVELYRNRELVDIPDNDGEHLDRFRRYQTAYVWKVCERPIEPDAECSNDVTINFGPSGTEATIVTPTGTRRVPVRVVD